MDEVRTERLLLRRFRAGDAEAFAAVNADPLVMRYLGSGEPIDRAASDALLARIVAHWDEHGFGLWAAELREDGRMIGFVGLAIRNSCRPCCPRSRSAGACAAMSGAEGLRPRAAARRSSTASARSASIG